MMFLLLLGKLSKQGNGILDASADITAFICTNFTLPNILKNE